MVPNQRRMRMIELAVGLFVGFWVILLGFWLSLQIFVAFVRCVEYVYNLPKNIVEFFKEIRRERAEMKRLGITEYGKYVEYIKLQERKKDEEHSKELESWRRFRTGLMKEYDC